MIWMLDTDILIHFINREENFDRIASSGCLRLPWPS